MKKTTRFFSSIVLFSFALSLNANNPITSEEKEQTEITQTQTQETKNTPTHWYEDEKIAKKIRYEILIETLKAVTFATIASYSTNILHETGHAIAGKLIRPNGEIQIHMNQSSSQKDYQNYLFKLGPYFFHKGNPFGSHHTSLTYQGNGKHF